MTKEKIIEHVKEVEGQQKYYEFYKFLPKILFWATVVFYGIIGIVLSSNIREGAGPFFLSLFIGVVLGAITYFLVKVSTSAIIMQTEYLAIIAKESAGEDYEEARKGLPNTVTLGTSTISFKGYTSIDKTASGWVCPKCGRRNLDTRYSCVDCGENKPFKNYVKVEEKEDNRPRWICSNCGYSNNPNAKACFECGKPKS